MTRGVRRLARSVSGLLLGILTLGLFLAAPAHAADDAVIEHAQPVKGAVRLLVSVPGTDEVDYDKIAVKIGGAGVTSKAAPASESSEVQRTSILAIDTSNSMKGQRIAEAKKAALAYLSTVPANVKVGVVTFDNTVKTLVAPTLNRGAATTRHQRTHAHPPDRSVRRCARCPSRRRARRRRRGPAQDPGPVRRQGHHRHPAQRRPRRGQAVRGRASTSSPCSRATRPTSP